MESALKLCTDTLLADVVELLEAPLLCFDACSQEVGVDYFPCKLAAVVFNDDPNVTNDDNEYRLVVQ